MRTSVITSSKNNLVTLKVRFFQKNIFLIYNKSYITAITKTIFANLLQVRCMLTMTKWILLLPPGAAGC